MGRKRDTITGISIGPRAIACAQCDPANALISNISIQPIEQVTGDFWGSVSSALKELVGNPEAKLVGERIVSALSGEYAIIKKIILDGDEKNIDQAIEWEFAQHCIDSPADYTYDIQPLNGGGVQPGQRYMVVGYRRESIEQIKRILTTNKLIPVVIDLDVFALINLFELNNKDRLATPAFIIYTEEEKTKIILTSKGEFVDLESIDHAAEIMDADEFVRTIRHGIDTILLSNPLIGDLQKCNVFLTGSAFSDDVFSRQILDGFAGSEILYPFRNISCSAGMKEDDLRHYSPQLAVAVGLALRENE
jgi:Tfp pilus assembly PilM family ATPase